MFGLKLTYKFTVQTWSSVKCEKSLMLTMLQAVMCIISQVPALNRCKGYTKQVHASPLDVKIKASRFTT